MSTARDLAADFEAMADRLRPHVVGILSMYADLGVTRTKAAASSFTHTSRSSSRSGRSYFPDPHVGGYRGEGPNVRTGDYRRTIGPAEVHDRGGGDFVATWGTNAPQGARLEFGYATTRSTIPPLPHFVPAVEWAQDQIAVALDRLVATL